MFRSASVLWERIFALGNGAHVILVARGANTDLSAVTQMGGITEAAEPVPLLRSARLAQDPRKAELWLYGLGTELPRVGRPLLTGGRWLSPTAADEIVLDPIYARDTNIALGHQIEMRSSGSRIPLTVVGFAVNPDLPYPSSAPAAYVLVDTLRRVEPERRNWETLLAFRLSTPETSESFLDNIAWRLPAGTLSFTRDWQRTRIGVQFNNTVNIVLVRIFSVLALLAVGLIVANTTSALVLARFREIGLLKAIGFTPFQVTLLFLVEHLTLGLLGGLIGIAAAFLLLPSLFTSAFLRRSAELLGGTWVLSTEPGVLLLTLLWIELVVGLFTLLPAWRGGRIATVQAILVGAGAVRARASRLGRLAGWLRQSPPIVLGAKEAFARRWRAWLTVGSLLLTTALATVALAGVGTLRAYASDPTQLGFLPANLLVRRGPISHGETLRILRAQPETAGVIAYAPLEAQTVGEPTISVVTKAVADGADLSRFELREGRMFSAPGEAVVPQGLLNRLGLRVGDELRLRSRDQPLQLRIVGRIYSNENLGMAAMYTLTTARQQVDPQLEATEYAVSLAAGADARAVQASLLHASDDQFGVVIWEMSEEVQRIQATLGALGAALILISLISLLNTTLLGVQEHMRDLGILKAIGMTPRQVVVSVMTGVTIQALLAAALGIPVGIVLTRAVYAWVTTQAGGGGDVPVPVNWAAITALVLLGSLLIAAVSSALPARRAAALQVAEALRHE